MYGRKLKIYLMSGTDYFHKQNDFNLHILTCTYVFYFMWSLNLANWNPCMYKYYMYMYIHYFFKFCF